MEAISYSENGSNATGILLQHKGVTYAITGEKSVWCRTTGSGHDKMQCTVQLTVFTDEVPRVKPLLISKGTGLRIPDKEKQQYDSRVVVQFQENAWFVEQIMLFCFSVERWKHFYNRKTI